MKLFMNYRDATPGYINDFVFAQFYEKLGQEYMLYISHDSERSITYFTHTIRIRKYVFPGNCVVRLGNKNTFMVYNRGDFTSYVNNALDYDMIRIKTDMANRNIGTYIIVFDDVILVAKNPNGNFTYYSICKKCLAAVHTEFVSNGHICEFAHNSDMSLLYFAQLK